MFITITNIFYVSYLKWPEEYDGREYIFQDTKKRIWNAKLKVKRVRHITDRYLEDMWGPKSQVCNVQVYFVNLSEYLTFLARKPFQFQQWLFIFMKIKSWCCKLQVFIKAGHEQHWHCWSFLIITKYICFIHYWHGFQLQMMGS